MLKRDVGATFSDIWYRVEGTRPLLSAHARVIRQTAGPAISYIVEEPASGRYYRLSEPAYAFMGMLDGRRTVGEAWDACCAQLGDEAPTQRECIELLSKLQLFGLLVGEDPLEADMVAERRAQAQRQRRAARTGRWLFLNIPLLNPEPWLRRHEHLCRTLFSRLAFGLWILVLGAGAVLVALNLSRFGNQLDLSVLMAPGNLLVLGVVFLFLRALHEFGHAMATKAFGGRVTEIGIILIAYVLPIPYCDATSAWRFPSARERIIVSMGGIYFEMFVAGIAASVWALTDPLQAPLIGALAYNVVLISGISTFLFNLNPLLRYDGYYVLSDLAGSPNLAQRSRDLWKWAFQKFGFGVRSATPPGVRDRAELVLLWVYSALSFPYRIFILVAIILAVASQYATVGLILATVVFCVVAIWPVMKLVGWLLSSPVLIGRRARAVGLVSLLLVSAGLLLGAVPAPNGLDVTGAIVPPPDAPVRAASAGFLVEVSRSQGERVSRGEHLLTLESPELFADLAIKRQQVARARIELEEAARKDPGESIVAQRSLESLLAEQSRLEELVGKLSLSAPAEGRLLAPDPSISDLRNQTGRHFARGDLIARVVDTDRLLVELSVADWKLAELLRGIGSDLNAEPEPVSIRVRGRAGEAIRGHVVRIVEAGTRELLNPSLAETAGGEVAVDAGDSSGRRTRLPQFVIDVRPDEQPEWWQPGLRAKVRFELEPEPLLSRWYRAGRRFLKDRVG